MGKLAFIFGLLFASLFATAQATTNLDEFDKDIQKFLSINGSNAAYDIAFDQIVQQFKMMKTEAPYEIWLEARTEIFDKEIISLSNRMAPIYKNHFTHQEIKELIEFYESELGKKMTNELASITKESIQLSHSWAMQLSGKINTFLQEKGY